MDKPQGATARLRRTFRYPGDADDADSQPEAMDEQEQEQLIATLTASNTARNAQFATFLLALPLLTTLPYIAPLLRHGSSSALSALLSLTSLLSTAFILRRLPPTVTGLAPLDAWSRSRDVVATAGARSPLEVYLPYLNAGLVVLLALMGIVAGEGDGFVVVGRGNLPGLVYGVVVLSKLVMAGVDPERELSALKYDYKGA